LLVEHDDLPADLLGVDNPNDAARRAQHPVTVVKPPPIKKIGVPAAEAQVSPLAAAVAKKKASRGEAFRRPEPSPSAFWIEVGTATPTRPPSPAPLLGRVIGRNYREELRGLRHLIQERLEQTADRGRALRLAP
jgi:hypothetical protein